MDPLWQGHSIVTDELGSVKTEYEPSTGPLVLNPTKTDIQRLWFLSMQASQTGDTKQWIARPEIIHTLQIDHNPGYLGFKDVN